MMYAVVLVDQQVQIWAVHQWHPYNSIAPNPEVVLEEWQGFSRSIEGDAS